MTERDAQSLWQDIVRLTTESNNPCTRSLRVALQMWLRAPASSRLRQLNHFLRSSRALLPKRKTVLPAATQGKFVFCFAADTPSSIKPLLPVVNEADNRGLLGGIVAPHVFPEIRGLAGQIPIVTMPMLISQLNIRERAGIATDALRTFHDISRMLADYHAPYAARFRENIGIALEEITTSLQMANAFRVLFGVWRPSAVVSAGDFWPFSYQFIYQASSLGIPSVLIQHGVSDFFWCPFAADLYCMWGDTDVNEMMRYGAPAEKLAAVGMPAMDGVFRQGATVEREPVRNGQPPVCLILSNSHGSAFEPRVFDDYRRFLIEAVKSTPSITWKVKLHPAEDDSFYRKMGSTVFERLVFYPRATSLRDAVADANVVTTIYSTAGLEAMIMNRPLIVAPVGSRVRELAPWPASGGGMYASSAEEFRSQFGNLVSDQDYNSRQMERQSSFLASHFANHGYAAQCVVDLMEQQEHRRRPYSVEHAGGRTLDAAMPCA